MQRANVCDVKTHLSRYLVLVEGGETVVVCRRNVPVAELRPVAPARRTARPIGLERGQFIVPDAFFEPLPPHLGPAQPRNPV